MSKLLEVRYRKKGHTYILRWHARMGRLVAIALERWADDPELNFTWVQAEKILTKAKDIEGRLK